MLKILQEILSELISTIVHALYLFLYKTEGMSSNRLILELCSMRYGRVA